MIKAITNFLLKIEGYLFVFEEWVMVVGLTTMIVLGTLQVVLRNFFSTGIEWADMLVRALVLWLGFLGASLATRKSKHIRIDIMAKIITGKKASAVRERIVNLVALFLVGLLLKASIEFTIIEAGNQMTAFLNVPTWVVFIIVPVSLLLIALRLLIEVIVGMPLEKDEWRENNMENL